MKRQIRADLAMTAAILLLGASLIYSGVSLLHLRRSWVGAEQAQPLNLPELVGVAGAGAGIALLCWWLLALVCACLGAAAQSMGAPHLAALSEAWSPAFMRRLVAAVLGMNLLAAPILGAAETPGMDPPWRAGAVAASRADIKPPFDITVPSAGPSSSASTSAAAVEPKWIPHPVATEPGPMFRPSPREDRPPIPTEAGQTGESASNIPAVQQRDENQVVVKSGDSLWSIVATTLGPYASDLDVALAWPNWYKANRATIGPDPNLILPGQVLSAPPIY